MQNDDLNEDWIRAMSWDLGFTTLEGLFGYLGVLSGTPGQQRDALARFTELPAWQAAPRQLQQETAAWLEAHGG